MKFSCKNNKHIINKIDLKIHILLAALAVASVMAVASLNDLKIQLRKLRDIVNIKDDQR